MFLSYNKDIKTLFISCKNDTYNFKGSWVTGNFVEFIDDFFITRIQSCAKLLGHFVILTTLPAPLKQCWQWLYTVNEGGVCVPQHCLVGEGGGGSKFRKWALNMYVLTHTHLLIMSVMTDIRTGVPTSFARDCIRVVKKSCTNFTKSSITNECFMLHTPFFQEIKIIL